MSISSNPELSESGDFAAEVLVSENVRSTHPPMPVLECVARAIHGDAGDDLTEEQHRNFKLSRRMAKFSISRFELSAGPIFVLYFGNAQGVFVGALCDLKDILEPDASKPHPFDFSDQRSTMIPLLPLREGEELELGKEAAELAEQHAATLKAARIVLEPDPAIRTELN
jgi:hypothetical protein